MGMTHKPEIIEKVWGREIHIVNNEFYCGKILELKKDHRCSIHMHIRKHETFHIVKGLILMELSDTGEKNIKHKFLMGVGETVIVPPKTLHRFSGIEDGEIMEISTHDFRGDSVRFTRSEYVENGSHEWLDAL